ncbi:MAG: hypothetical protein JRF49_12120 [Deltaproteobacteria bacterium]|nr:hypothetical protein [Deltaproteobacteria bacterium]
MKKIKVVTKRKQIENHLEDARRLQRTINRLRGYALIPVGVYRFKTFQEADQWMIKTIASTHASLNLKT